MYVKLTSCICQQQISKRMSIDINLHIDTKSQSSHSQADNKTSPSTSTIRYLRDKSHHQSKTKQFYKNSSLQSETDRSNFCFNLHNSSYSVMRVYIDAISQKQIRLYYTKFTPSIKKAQICIIHGYGQNTDDYLVMAQYYAKRGYVVNMIDMRGFGYSGGSRVNQPTKKILMDIQTLLRNCNQRGLRTFIIAHGLGAMFLNALLQQNSQLPISGVINLTPLVSFINNDRSWTLQRFLLKLSPTIFNNILVHNKINPTALAKDPCAIKQKIQSIFWESFITLRMAHQYQKVGEKVRSQGYKFIYPTLFCVGAKDAIQDFQQIKNYYNSLSSQDKQIIIFREGYHQLHIDYQSDQLMLKVYNWMESRKDKIRWKQPQKLSKQGVVKKNKFWIKIIGIVGFLIFVIGLIKRMKLIKIF